MYMRADDVRAQINLGIFINDLLSLLVFTLRFFCHNKVVPWQYTVFGLGKCD